MKNSIKYCLNLIIVATVFGFGVVLAQETPTNPGAGAPRQSGFQFFQAAKQRRGFSLIPSSRIPNTGHPESSLTPATSNLQVLGGGTLGRLTKWTGFGANNSFIGDSTIFESKSGLVGIGTDTPSSKLTVAGTIEITQGGLKFPDGSVLMSGQGVVAPFILQGSVPNLHFRDAVIEATNVGDSGAAVFAQGGDGATLAGVGVNAQGGNSPRAAEATASMAKGDKVTPALAMAVPASLAPADSALPAESAWRL